MNECEILKELGFSDGMRAFDGMLMSPFEITS